MSVIHNITNINIVHSVSITFCISSVCTIIETTLYCSNTLFQKQYSLYVYKNKLQTIHDTLYTIHNYIIIIIAEDDINLGITIFFQPHINTFQDC